MSYSWQPRFGCSGLWNIYKYKSFAKSLKKKKKVTFTGIWKVILKISHFTLLNKIFCIMQNLHFSRKIWYYRTAISKRGCLHEIRVLLTRAEKIENFSILISIFIVIISILIFFRFRFFKIFSISIFFDFGFSKFFDFDYRFRFVLKF